jgi:amino acid transporter
MATSEKPERREYVDVDTGQHYELAKGALGLPQVLFCIVTGAAPIAAMLFNTPVVVLGAGYAVPAAFLIATVVLTIFSVGYIEMARKVTAAGGFYSFVSHAFGPVLGLGTAVLITACYIFFSGAVIGVTAYFANTSINDWFSVDIPVWLIMFGSLAIMAALAFFHVELTARILGVFLISEVVGLLVFGFAVLFQGGKDGIPMDAINPLEVWADGNTAILGASATGIALFGAFWSWVGFEMAPNYAEESKEPKRIMAPATYISVIGLGILYMFITWMFVAGWGKDGVADGVNGQFAGDYGSAYYPLTDEFGGEWLTTLFEILIITGSFACQFAFFNTATRYIFSMGREGILPRSLGRTHPIHKSPYIAAGTVTVLVGAYVLGFVIYDSSTLGALTKLGTWSPLLGVSGILAIQALVSAAIIYYFLTTAKDGANPLKTLIAPLVAAATQIYAVYLLMANRETLAASDVPFITLMPWIALAIFIVGILLALYYRSSDQGRYAGIGRFVHEDSAPTT